jgi:hypothetical protein
MKAVVVHEPGKATLTDIPEPSNASGETFSAHPMHCPTISTK